MTEKKFEIHGEFQKDKFEIHHEFQIYADDILISDVKPMQKSMLYPESEKQLETLVEYPVLDAAKELFKKGIKTYASSANGVNISEGAYVIVYYDSLNSHNKKIAEKFHVYESTYEPIKQKLVKIHIPVTDTMTVGDVKNSFADIVDKFETQEQNRSDIESEIISSIGNEIIDQEKFKDFMLQNGFAVGRRGTFESKEKGVYLYIKQCLLVKTEKEAQDSLLFLKYLTEKGIVYPSTEWGVYKNKIGEYQIFGLTRKLEVYTPEGQTKEGRDVLKRDISAGNSYLGLFDEDSHVLEWFRRIDKDFDADKKESIESICTVLNPLEASHSSNWAWDEKGKLYPIDVEVISLVEHDGKINPQVEKWVKRNSE